MHILIKQSQWNWLLLLDVEYTYVEEQYCAGDYIGTFSSLEAAKAACKINSDCQCIHHSFCSDMDGREYYQTHKDVPSKWTSGYSNYCAWIPGNDALILYKVESMWPYLAWVQIRVNDILYLIA